MTSKPVVSVYISVAHVVDGVTTIVNATGYAIDISEHITVQDAQLASTVAVRKFTLSLNDRIGELMESYRVAAERAPGMMRAAGESPD